MNHDARPAESAPEEPRRQMPIEWLALIVVVVIAVLAGLIAIAIPMLAWMGA